MIHDFPMNFHKKKLQKSYKVISSKINTLELEVADSSRHD